MPGNKKPRRKYQRKRMPAFAGLDMLNRAHIVESVREKYHVPLSEEDQRDVNIACGLSIDAIVMGKGTHEHMNCLALMCNTSLVLTEYGFGKQYEKNLIAALDALFRMQLRFKRSGVWEFDEIGREAMRTAYDVHVAQVQVAGQGDLMAAGNVVNQRVKEGNVYREAA